ncbi:MAG TPA: siderophore-interacting protein, partial [Ilumatobacteraceae bacterium]|nr:siderophore-interacting protein [Ilumatobacteraceae bacterium]
TDDSTATKSLEQHRAEMDAIPTLFTQVVRVEALTPHLKRITFGGGDLVEFVPKSPDQFMYVLLPPPGQSETKPGRFSFSVP